MKYIEKIFLLIVLMGFGLSSCTVDEPIVVTPKTLDQYIDQFGKFVKAEKLFVDSCKISYKKGDYAVASTSSFNTYKANYLAALKADSTIIFTPGVTIAQIVAGDFSLAVPGKAFRAKLNIADLRELNDSIVSATNFNNTVLVGNAAGNVLQYDKTQFSNAIALAIGTRDLLTSIDRQVQAALASIKSAKATFIAAIIPADLPAFIASSTNYVAAQLLIVNKSVVGYDMNQYLPTLRTNYLNVLRTDSTLFATPSGLTYAQVVTAMNNLVAPRTAFVPNVSDRRALNDSITAATAYNATITVGTASGQVPQASKTTFTSAITTASSSRDNPLTTDGSVKAANYALTVAKQKFVATIIK